MTDARVTTTMDRVLQDAAWHPYTDYNTTQRPRIEYLVGLIDEFAPGDGQTVLDAGPAIQTSVVRGLRPDLSVDSIGYAFDPVKLRDRDTHFEYDLNLLYDLSTWPAIGPYDVIVLAEVLEHLCTAPQTLFNALASWLAPGGRLIVQTPNALDLPSRVRGLLGRSPSGGIATLPEAGMNPGHFREYTIPEVVALGERAGMSVERRVVLEYFDRPGLLGRSWSQLSRRLPESLRTGTTVVFRR